MKLTNRGIGKRALAILLSAVMVLSLCATVMETRAAETYTVTFDANGGTFPEYYTKGNKLYISEGSTLKITVAAGEQTVFPFVEKNAEGSSQYLPCNGWGVTGAEYKMGAKTPQINSDITYKASWVNSSSSSTISVRIADGDGHNIDFNMPSTGELYVPENPYPPSTNRKFTGWTIQLTCSWFPSMDKKEEKKIEDIGDKINIGSFHDYVTLTVVCEPIETQFLVRYHYNPPAGCEVPKDVVNNPYGTSSNEIYDVNIKEKASQSCDFTPLVGYESLGWSTDPKATEAESKYAPGNTVTLTDDLDLYVVWEYTEYPCTLDCQYYNNDGTSASSETTEELPAHMPYEDILTYKPELESGTYNGHHYTLTAVETSGTVEKDAKNITLRYEYDELNDAGNSQTGGDNIPDKFQRLVTYKIQNGKWSDGTEDDKIEVVTLLDEYGARSMTGTATLENVPEGERIDAKHSETGIWSTGDGKKPETIGSSDATTFTLTFLEAGKAIIIKPSSSAEVQYDGEKHTFNVFEAWDINGNKLENVVVTVKISLPEEFYGISAGQTVDIQSWLSENGKTWNEFFTVKVDGEEISLSDNAVIFQTGEVGIVPKPLKITIKLQKDTDANVSYEYKSGELTVCYCYDADQHTVALTDGVLMIDERELAEKDKETKFGLSDAEGNPLSMTAAYVVKEGEEVSDIGTIDLTPGKLRLTGDGSENYTINEVTVDASNIDVTLSTPITSLSLKITPRQVNYRTYGASKVFNGDIITRYGYYSDTEYRNYDEAKAWPQFALTEDLKEPEDIGFVVRHYTGESDDLRRNQQPQEVRLPKQADVDAERCGEDCYLEGEVNAGIYEYMVLFDDYADYYSNKTNGLTPYTFYPGANPDNQHFLDYMLNYQNDYITIYPQSFDSSKTFDEAEGLTVYKYEDTSVPADAALEAYYTGVYLVNEPENTYTYDGGEHKFTTQIRNENNVNNTDKGIDYRLLVEGRDYTVKYERLGEGGSWTETTDFTNTGKIRVTFTGIGNYRDSITREYEIVDTGYRPDPPAPPPPGNTLQPDVEIDDRDHYAYIIGKPGGIVDPDGQITRAEIATVIFRLLKEEVREEYWSKVNTFPDVQITDWYNNAISTLENLGIVNGKDDGLFHPDDPITRAEMAAMMARLYDYDLNTGDFHTKFDDIDPNAWYARYVKAAEDLGLFLGDGATNHFYPNRSLTRAEAMTVYNRLLDRKPHKDGLLPPEQMILWPDNMDTGAWYYADVQEATNSHTCAIDGLAVDDKTYERWLESLPVRDWAALERAWSEAHSGYDGHDVN